MNQYDVIIVGGGCAGLSIADRLTNSEHSVLVIEPRTEYQDDRRWAFWQREPGYFESCIDTRWSSWSAALNGKEVIRSDPQWEYVSLPAGRFYQYVAARIRKSHNIHTSQQSVVGIEQHGDFDFHVVMAEETLNARYVIDTRPGASAFSYGQYFCGIEVEAEKSLFDDSKAVLMDFVPARDDSIVFRYVLPFSPTHALIEYTVFSAHHLSPTSLQGHALSAAQDVLGQVDYQVLRTEYGALPMQLSVAHLQSKAGFYRAGLGGGAGRAATGYAFQRIQQQADWIATNISRGEAKPLPTLDSPFVRWMDKTFLSVIKAQPRLGPELFHSLFEKARPGTLEAFLSGHASYADCARVIQAMPKRRFLKALCTHAA